MDDGLPLKPDTGWGTEVRRLMKDPGCDFDHAFAKVMARYLNQGDTRPLFDLVQRAKKEPEEPALRFLAKMFNLLPQASSSDVEIQYRFGFEPFRAKRGRPGPVEATKAKAAGIVFSVLLNGVAKMAEGQKPGPIFWQYLFNAFDQTQRGSTTQSDFPVSAKLVRIDGSRGRRIDPELATRDKVLASFVEQHIKEGRGYDSSIKETRDELRRIARDEGWQGKVGEKTIKDAYDTRPKKMG